MQTIVKYKCKVGIFKESEKKQYETIGIKIIVAKIVFLFKYFYTGEENIEFV